MIDSGSFRKAMGCFATGIAVATLKDKEIGLLGITINSLTSVSLKPPLLLFCLDHKAHVFPAFQRTKTFALNILDETQENVSRHFAQLLFPEPKGLWKKNYKGCPHLSHTLAVLFCQSQKKIKAGDHTIFLARVTSIKMGTSKRNPLLYYHSRYQKLDPKSKTVAQ